MNAILQFLGFFWGHMPWMIEAAAFLAGLIRRWEDSFIIPAMLLLNTETLQYALVLTVAAVPATLPAVLSVTWFSRPLDTVRGRCYPKSIPRRLLFAFWVLRQAPEVPFGLLFPFLFPLLGWKEGR